MLFAFTFAMTLLLILDLYMQLNTFQCVVATDGDMTFAIFLYNQLEWSQGQNSALARVGFYSGIEAVFF